MEALMGSGISIFGVLGGLGVLSAGIGYGYSQFKSGASKAKDELVTTLKDQLDVEKATVTDLKEKNQVLIKSHQEQINTLNKEIGKLQGLHESSEIKLKEYLQILQNRNPELEKFILDTTQTAKNAEIFMKNNTEMLGSILEFMKLMEARTTITQSGVEHLNKISKGGDK